MTDDFIVDLKGYILREHKSPREAWCDPDDVQAALDEIERLQEEVQELKRDSTIFIIERGEAIGENADLREEIERLRAALREYGCNCPKNCCHAVGLNYNDVCGDGARAALAGEKAND